MNQRNPAIAVATLAAGKGTRMRSQLPKVLHKLGALTLVERTLDTAQHLSPDRCFAIVGYARERVRETLADREIEFVEQTEQLGTGHAVQQLLPYLEGFQGDLLVLNADVPLLRESTLQTLVRAHRTKQAAATLLTAQVTDPSGYGRVICGVDAAVKEIVEDRDCTPAQLSHKRINGGIYCFHWPDLAKVLPQLSSNNSQQEYYLTDAIAMLPSAYAVDVPDAQELQGINDRLQLAQAYTALQQRIKEDWMRAGVTFVDPNSTTVADTVQLEPDCIIEPQTHLRGSTIVRTGCQIGPNCLIENSSIGANSRVLYSAIADSQIGEGVTIGPFAHLRDNVVVGDRCRIGNFVEVKQTAIGPDSNAAHLSYLGDASLGRQVNIGAGTITANFDGKEKHPTIIGDRSKTGSNSVLVAPIEIGADVTIAAGSTLTESVPDDCLAIARSRQTVKQDWRPRSKET
ncbi:bifunctional UDP-N-acetylglucosamine diphosphorylase/glucosamine-1-phosphate N-acetyltransferase GlmU [Synechococcus sp. PCC 7336]|uniref:bifunctional UDP-N-acetylglucosamine diphosphorylase/glucosamine-1-phosphate N-acetyltransferase GlmU n=1 Tax=Synechococcus sp. PCC 7336 TaxID=195250 RepID=UPI00037E3E22|nr:bifunctional UDP-N-acetylglucosamine diphosphorylase/glucosamine-1-phosphate N-acetyltransferase GlmU [Synechococcus sp. PCC 7336]